MTTPAIGKIEFDGVDPFYRPAGAPIKPSIPTMEYGFRECIEAYAVQVGKTVDELQADDIWPVRCRCKPGTDNPHCGGFFVAKGSMEAVDDGVQVYRSVPLTSAHTPNAARTYVAPSLPMPQFDWPIGQHVDDLGWKVNVCVAHSYVGHPPCPYPDCANGNDKVTVRGIYSSVKVERLMRNDSPALDEYSVTSERVWVRRAFNAPKGEYPIRRRWYTWIEVVPKGSDATATMFNDLKKKKAAAQQPGQKETT